MEKQVHTLKQALEITSEPNEHLQAEVESLRSALNLSQKKSDELESKYKLLESHASSPTVDSSGTSDKELHQENLRLKDILASQSTELVQHADKARISSRQKAQIQSELATAMSELKSLKSQFNLNAEELSQCTCELKETTEQLEKVTLELSEQSNGTDQMKRELTSMQEEYDVFYISNKSLTSDIENKKLLLDTVKSQYTTAQEELKRLGTDLEDERMNNKIAAKRSRQLIKELQSELSKSHESGILQIQELTKVNKSLEGELGQLGIKYESECSELKQANMRLKQDLEVSKKNKGSLSSLMRIKTTNPTTPSSPIDDEVKLALAKRLESLLGENQTLKEKVTFLESNVHSYAEELETIKCRANLKTSRELEM